MSFNAVASVRHCPDGGNLQAARVAANSTPPRTATPHVGQLRPFGQLFRSPCSGQHRTSATSAKSSCSFAKLMCAPPLKGATRRNTISFKSTLIAAGLARSGMCACRHVCLFSGVVALGGAVTPVRSTPILNEGAAVQVPPNTKQTALSDGRYLTGLHRRKPNKINALCLFSMS